MKLPNTAHTSRPWRIHELTRDFRLEDVWALATPGGPDFDALPFTSLYLLKHEWAAKIANRTMHGVMHIGWVPDGTGGYRGQMAVLVKPNGLLGTGYMAAIKPFRHLIVYPSMMREIERKWRALAGDPKRRTPEDSSPRNPAASTQRRHSGTCPAPRRGGNRHFRS